MPFTLAEGTFDALIFDCDGTLVDSAPAHLNSIQQALAPLGLTMSPEWYAPRHGLSPDGLLDAYEAEFKVDAIAREALWERNNAAFQASVPLIREITLIANIARQWHGRVPMAVASNGVIENVEATLRATNLLHLFSTIVTADDVAHGKPSPDVYLEAARRMNVSPTRCVVFEDSDEGLEAARRAGMKAKDIRESVSSAPASPDNP
jgi:beta-phosphoglucomutase-like phosphatase (HAD superfamily)